ncbi:MAG: Hpt domain-containing protein [Sulfurovum sp.]|nr:MAG: Hpt domain-containing protein [Sulfurovum sp.]
MYYGYNQKNQLILADREFINLFGYKVFSELEQSNVINNAQVEKDKVTFFHQKLAIHAKYKLRELLSYDDVIFSMELSNIVTEENVEGKQVKKRIEPQAIYLDVHKISSEVGLSVDDYKLYLDGFIDQSIIDEPKLKNANDKSIKSLSALASMLKIPDVNILLLKIQKSSSIEERIDLIDEYYNRLALLTLDESKKSIKNIETKTVEVKKIEIKVTPKVEPKIELKPIEEKKVEPEIEQKFEIKNNDFNFDDFDLELFENDTDTKTPPENKNPDRLDLKFNELFGDFDMKNNKNTQNNKTEEFEDFKHDLPAMTPKIKPTTSGVAEIDFNTIKALPIHYNPKLAADELNLPIVLIEEFVEDFIQQAKQDRDHLLASYYQKDMDNIHELGHKLKGAASNLRINEIADALEDIQFCDDHDKLRDMFIKYWGYFISLEDFMATSKRG